MTKRFLNVFLYGKNVGVLTETPSSSLSFKYETDAIETVSVRMPVRKEIYRDSYARPFFENLTPEAEIKTLIAKNIGVSENNPFSLLDKLGGDCAGAISLYRDENIPTSINENLEEITEDNLISIIKKLPKNPLLISDKNARLSLAGAQPKFALVYKDGKYFYPNDRFPSTHIVKIENKNYKGLLENEFFCMKLAKELNIPVPNIDLKQVNGIKYLLIERYDREVKKDNIKRIHQEDFCQVLGFLSDKKYQMDGGPSIKKCYNAILEYVNTQLSLNIRNFLEIIMYNYLIGNNDAHAKNFSILHLKNNNITLSPFYDLVSTEIYSDLSHNLAMNIGKQKISDKVNLNDFKLLATELDKKANIFDEMLLGKFSDIYNIANNLANALNKSKLTKSVIYNDIIKLISERYTKFVK